MNKITLILTLLFAHALSGQSSLEFSLDLEAGSEHSPEFEVKYPENSAFAQVSAYLLEEGADQKLFYQIFTNGNWSPWKSLKKFDHGETPGRSSFSGEYELNHFSRIRFRSDLYSEENVHFRVFFPARKSTDIGNTETLSLKSQGCNCPPPSICDRNCWCPSGNCPQNYTPVINVPTHLIIHHSAGSNNSPDYAAVVAAIWDFHVNTNGWDDIGYNWLIDPMGVVYEGRGQNVLGAHFSCMNTDATGICLLGNFMNFNPTVKAKQALQELLAFEGCSNSIELADSSLHQPSGLVLSHISSHRDANESTAGCPKGTVCPGDFLYAQLESIRSKTAAKGCLQTIGTNHENTSEISVYPNPGRGYFYIQGLERSTQYKVYNALGQMVNAGSTAGDLKLKLEAGAYFLALKMGHQERVVKLLIR